MALIPKVEPKQEKKVVSARALLIVLNVMWI